MRVTANCFCLLRRQRMRRPCADIMGNTKYQKVSAPVHFFSFFIWRHQILKSQRPSIFLAWWGIMMEREIEEHINKRRRLLAASALLFSHGMERQCPSTFAIYGHYKGEGRSHQRGRRERKEILESRCPSIFAKGIVVLGVCTNSRFWKVPFTVTTRPCGD